MDGGDVKVIKNGRKVQAYQLMNPKDFDKNGRFIPIKAVTSPTPVPVPANDEEPEELEAA